jgi:hypothetical protein
MLLDFACLDFLIVRRFSWKIGLKIQIHEHNPEKKAWKEGGHH